MAQLSKQFTGQATKTRARGGDKALILNSENSSAVALLPIDANPKAGAHRNVMMFLTNLFKDGLNRRINIRILGTSMSYGKKAVPLAVNALQRYYGPSNISYLQAASQGATAINGWKTQYSSCPYSIRIRGISGDGATPIKVQCYRAKYFVVSYSTETDGGTITVGLQTGAGNVEAQASINCNGTKSYQNLAVYTLDPTQNSEITLTPPSSGYGYLEYWIVDPDDFGVTVQNCSYGGSGIGNLAGTIRRGTGGAQYAANYSDDPELGLRASFAPTDARIKPDILFLSTPTNDFNGHSTEFIAALNAGAGYALANGSSLIIAIEPANGAVASHSADWMACRDAIFALRDANPDNVFVFDGDAISDPAIAYNDHFHDPGDTTHLDDNGYGDPDVMQASQLCAFLNVPMLSVINPLSLIRDVRDVGLAVGYRDSKEPRNCPIGSIWVDTSVTPTITKRLLKVLPNGRGIWNNENASDNLLWALNTASPTTGDVTTTNFHGYPAITHTSETWYTVGALAAGQKYTLSLIVEGNSSNPAIGLALYQAVWPRAYLNRIAQKMILATNGNDATESIYLDGYGAIFRYVITFTAPTTEEAAALALQGVTGDYYLRLGTVQNSAVATIWDCRIEKGASLTIGKYV